MIMLFGLGYGLGSALGDVGGTSYFAFLAGLFFHREHEAPARQQALPERRPEQAPAPQPAPQPENSRNPFAD